MTLYNKIQYRIQYGFPNLRVKEAEQLKAWKDERIKELKEEHPAWAEDYDTPPNTQVWQNKIKDLEEIVLKASKSVGGGILGVDLMESEDGFLVHEINNNVEFKGVSKFTKENIAYKIVDYVDNISKR